MTDVDKMRAAIAGLKETELHVYPADHGFNCDQRGQLRRRGGQSGLAAQPGFPAPAPGLNCYGLSPN